MNVSGAFSPHNADTLLISSRNVIISVSKPTCGCGASPPTSTIAPCMLGIPWDQLGRNSILLFVHVGPKFLFEKHGQGGDCLEMRGEAEFYLFSSAWEAGGLEDGSSLANSTDTLPLCPG